MTDESEVNRAGGGVGRKLELFQNKQSRQERDQVLSGEWTLSLLSLVLQRPIKSGEGRGGQEPPAARRDADQQTSEMTLGNHSGIREIGTFQQYLVVFHRFSYF